MLLVFPGQGSQKVGMGKDIYDAFQCARDVFHEVNDSISFNLSDVIFNGTEEQLKSTENTQPGLMAVSIAFLKVMQIERGIDLVDAAKYLSGHSLGEYTALCAAGVLSLSDTAKILRTRGKLMSEAFPIGGAMAAILGLGVDIITQIVSDVNKKEGMVQLANDNAEGQVVVSGLKSSIESVMKFANSAGAKKTVLLEVSGPFHSELMEKAAVFLSDYLRDINFADPRKPIISNVTAEAENGNFKKLLLEQIIKPVRWRESMLFAAKNEVSTCVEIGSGKVLTGLGKRISPEINNITINSFESAMEFALEL